jgi:hypothetical protein
VDSSVGNYRSAFENYRKHIELRDSLINAENTRLSVQQQMQYEFDKKEAILKEEQIRQNEVAEAESKRQKLFLMLIAAVALSVAVIAIIVFRALRVARSQKSIIEKQKVLVEEKQKEILDSIHYAHRIQKALITNENYIQKNLTRFRTGFEKKNK